MLQDPVTPCHTQKTEFEFPLVTTPPNVTTVGDQTELQTLVDAIAAASQREAEAHETAIILSKENDGLRTKIKMLIDDNNKLIELYERAVADNQHSISSSEAQGIKSVEFAQEMKTEKEHLEHQLTEMHEENDKLMGLYEKAMQERDELKRLLSSVGPQSRHGDANEEHSELLDVDEPCATPIVEDFKCIDEPKVEDRFVNIREKLEKAHIKLSKSSESVGLFRSLERGIIEIDRVSRDIQSLESVLEVKQKDYASHNLIISDLKQQETALERKLTALRFSMANFSSSLGYFQQREAQTRARSHASSTQLKLKKKEIAAVEATRDETERLHSTIKQSETELKNNIATLKLKIEEENKKREKDTVLLENTNWQIGGKASELLKSEEEKTKLQLQMSHDREKLETVRKESEKLTKKLRDLDREIQTAQMEIQKYTKSMEETETKLRSVVEEKEIVLEMKETGMIEFENLLIEFVELLFKSKVKEEETRILKEEVEMRMKREEELQGERRSSLQKVSGVLEETSGMLSEKLGDDLQDLCSSFMELRSVLES